MQIEAKPEHLINYYQQRAHEHEHALAIHASVVEQLRAQIAVLEAKLAPHEAGNADS